MGNRFKIFVAESTDPWLNLATEDWLFQTFDHFEHALFLWCNTDTVVIGRSQNPWLECKLDAMQRDGVHLARRQSGGGAVYHDLGNTNFTFLSKKPLYDKQRNLSIVIAALKALGVEAHFSGRNDILLNEASPRKISGNAFKEKSDRAFHHGTLLVNADLTRLANYLNPHRKKLQAKGVTSVRSRVANLSEVVPGIDHDDLCQHMMMAFCQTYGEAITPAPISLASAEREPALQSAYRHLQSWQWRYGQTLPFTHQFDHRFDWGVVDVHLVVKNGVIQQARIYTDALHPEWLEQLAVELQGKHYGVAALSATNTDAREFVVWLQQQMA